MSEEKAMAFRAITNKGPDYEGEQGWLKTFDLWYLGGDKPTDDESFDLYVEQASKDTHFAMLTFVNGSTCYSLTNLNPTGLRAVANYLLDCAVSLEAAGDRDDL